MEQLLFISWGPSPEIVQLFGKFALRYYSLLFASGLILGYYLMQHIYKKEKLPLESLEQLSVYVFLGVLIGARVGHCLFYEPTYYLHHLHEMILPFRFGPNGFEFTGFQGLASHGGGTGVIIALAIYCKKTKTNFLWLTDRVALLVPLAGGFIRLGNLMNSEIIGSPSNLPWAFVFELRDSIPRHPAQLYEAISYFILFGALYYLYVNYRDNKGNGYIFGVFLVLVSVIRFFIEFVKKNQVNFEEGMALNMGQLLSLPFLLVGIYLIVTHKSRITANKKK